MPSTPTTVLRIVADEMGQILERSHVRGCAQSEYRESDRLTSRVQSVSPVLVLSEKEDLLLGCPPGNITPSDIMATEIEGGIDVHRRERRRERSEDIDRDEEIYILVGMYSCMYRTPYIYREVMQER